uniref:malectin domain-containing carbohydrate-binding protein n=1 Tax=Proteiniphilum sp. UBA1028 TaxID=1947251 RepID=UPI0025E9B22D
ARKSDQHWGSVSWADKYENMNPYQGSQRYTDDPIKGTRNWKLFGQFRYGRHELAYHFPLPDGEYRVELYFTEPWYGTGGIRDGEGYRVFDVALNDSVYIRDLDIWAESGHDRALKKVLTAKVQGGALKISFPQVKAGQALISAIAIASRNQDIRPAASSPSEGWSWNDVEKVAKTPVESLPEGDDGRLATVYPAEDAVIEGEVEINEVRKRVSLNFTGSAPGSISWDVSTGVANIYAFRFSYMNVSNSPKEVRFRLVASDGTILKDDLITFPVAPEKWRTLSTSTDGFINAGHYRVILSSENMKGLNLNSLTVQ